MTEKEMRKHIKPFLRFAIQNMANQFKKEGDCWGICYQVVKYRRKMHLPYSWEVYIEDRLKGVRPKDSGDGEYWWGSDSIFEKEGLNKRIAFCKLQLKIVKP